MRGEGRWRGGREECWVREGEIEKGKEREVERERKGGREERRERERKREGERERDSTMERTIIDDWFTSC